MSEPSKDYIRNVINHYEMDWADTNLSERLQKYNELIQEFDKTWDDLFCELDSLKSAINDADITDYAEGVAVTLAAITDMYAEFAEYMLNGTHRDEDAADWVEFMKIRDEIIEQKFYQSCGADMYEATSDAALWSLTDVYREWDDKAGTPDPLTTVYNETIKHAIHNILYYSPQREITQDAFKKATSNYQLNPTSTPDGLSNNDVNEILNNISTHDSHLKQPNTLQVAINHHDASLRKLQNTMYGHLKLKTISKKELDEAIDTWTSKLTFLADTLMADKETTNPQEIFASIVRQSTLDHYEVMMSLDSKFTLETMTPMYEKLLVTTFTEYNDQEPSMTFSNMTPEGACHLLKNHILKNIAQIKIR